MIGSALSVALHFPSLLDFAVILGNFGMRDLA